MDTRVHLTVLLQVVSIIAIQAIFLRGLTGIASDHPVHQFLVRQIRKNGGKLFVKVPGLLNTAYCSAYPLGMHWLLAKIPVEVQERFVPLINPMANIVVGISGYMLLVHSGGLESREAITYLTVGLIIIAPSLNLITNARHVGLSARGLGLALSVLYWLVFLTNPFQEESINLLLLTCLATLIVFMSTFGAQALVFFSAGFVVFGEIIPLATTIAGIIVFVLVLDQYALHYLKHTVRFLGAYRRYLAPLFLFSKRPSIWMDLVRDIWIQVRKHPRKAIHYAAQNPIVQLLVLNPVALFAAVASMTSESSSDFTAKAHQLTYISFGIFFLTTLRPLRFLGEPERYLEITIPLMTVLTADYLVKQNSTWGLVVLGVYYTTVMIAQQRAARILRSSWVKTYEKLIIAKEQIARHARETECQVRFMSDNDQYVKFFMTEDWSFCRFWSADTPVAGYRVDQAISHYPFIRPEVVLDCIKTYDLNVLVLDKKNPEKIHEKFTNEASEVIFENNDLACLSVGQLPMLE